MSRCVARAMSTPSQFVPQNSDAFALGFDVGLRGLVAVRIAVTSLSPTDPAGLSKLGVRRLLVHRETHAEAKLRVVLKQRVGPRRAAAARC